MYNNTVTFLTDTKSLMSYISHLIPRYSVLQGSVLRLLLFIVYINGIASEHGKFLFLRTILTHLLLESQYVHHVVRIV